ncbi:MAG: radical SAM protein [Myxococcales bacterium]|nr:radical SAM protein [Myxococcales bacterium]MCB9531484.1 radical SAM protein [Myxococcales bacterium]
MKALVKVGYACNNHCTFCHTLDVREIDDTTLGVHAKIERAARLGYSMVVLSGGEPTMRPELLRWAKHAHSKGLAFGLVTNARMLAYPAIVDRLQELGLAYVYMSLHGGTAKVHNAMVRAHAFEDTFGAVEVLSGRGLDLTVNCVVTSRNADALRPIVDLLLPFDDVVLKFSMVQPKGSADKLFTAVIPPVSLVAARVADAIHYGRERSTGLRFAHDGIPLCLLPGLEGLYDDLKTHGFAAMTEVYEPDFYPVDTGDSAQTDRCVGCALRGPCVGLFRKYYEQFGDAELRPVGGTRSNSYNFVPERELEWPTGAPCPIRGATLPYDHGRHVFVRDGSRMRQFRTETRDFSDRELRDIKNERGQIYLDVSDKLAPDDFAADLRKLSPLDVCGGCPDAASCTGCYIPVADDIFSLDDARVRDAIAGLSGEILDVGCGETRYADVLAPRAVAGTIRYLGIEPSATHAAAFTARHPWADVRQSPIEAVELAPSSFDHVLVLRSYNHFASPGDVLERLALALRPGGTLLVVDNVAFGLVRESEHATAAERGPAEFEHYNNHASEDALRYAPSHLLELEEHVPVSPSGSNQWLLRFRRTDAPEPPASTA